MDKATTDTVNAVYAIAERWLSHPASRPYALDLPNGNDITIWVPPHVANQIMLAGYVLRTARV